MPSKVFDTAARLGLPMVFQALPFQCWVKVWKVLGVGYRVPIAHAFVAESTTSALSSAPLVAGIAIRCHAPLDHCTAYGENVLPL